MKRRHLQYLCVVALASLGLTVGFESVLQPGNAAPSDETAQPQAQVEPEARQALEQMSAYLGTLQTFELKSDTTIDQVFDNGQKLQFDGHVIYKVRRPNGFVIDLSTDRKVRRFYYNGKTFTLVAPVSGLYAEVSAPPTIREVLDVLADDYGIEIPMTDLFRWSDPNDNRAESLISGVYVGYAKINGVDSDHYAFREADVDWQIWIARGDRPLPLKMVITSTTLPAAPQFVSYLTWTENPSYGDETFEFHPGADNFQIEFSESQE